jgi:hypothetical protein
MSGRTLTLLAALPLPDALISPDVSFPANQRRLLERWAGGQHPSSVGILTIGIAWGVSQLSCPLELLHALLGHPPSQRKLVKTTLASRVARGSTNSLSFFGGWFHRVPQSPSRASAFHPRPMMIDRGILVANEIVTCSLRLLVPPLGFLPRDSTARTHHARGVLVRSSRQFEADGHGWPSCYSTRENVEKN